MSAVTPGRVMIEARQIARDHALLLIEKPGPERTLYIIYRPLPDGRKSFLGKRGTPAGVHAYLKKLTSLKGSPCPTSACLTA